MKDRSSIPELQARIMEAAGDAAENTAQKAVNRVDTGFNRGEDAMGSPWEELADATIAEKGHASILIDEANMKNSNTYVTQKSAGRARIGTNDPKATYHETGIPENGLPARPIYGPLAQWLEENNVLEDELADEVNSAIARSSL